MNVLIYSGPGVSQTSLSHTLTTLRALLLPHYAVQTVTAPALASHPWSSTCALLVIPGGRDLPYLSALAAATPAIKSFVKNGGKYLGFCAGAYFASKRVEWEVGTPMEVSGERPLRFFDGLCRGCVFPGFQYETEEGAKAVTLNTDSDKIEGLYYNGGGEFVDVETVPHTKVLARYVDAGGEGKVAGVSCPVGKGHAVLWAIHPEYSLTREPGSLAIRRTRPDLVHDQILRSEDNRWELMRKTLDILGLHLPSRSAAQPCRALPQFLTSSPQKPEIVSRIMQALSEHIVGNSIQDSNDSFEFHAIENSHDLLSTLRSSITFEPEADKQPRHVIVCSSGSLPTKQETPLFNIKQYYNSLAQTHLPSGNNNASNQEWGMGEALLYGEVVTSTQTMLDKNPKLLSCLPSPLLSLASHQLSGRGRGSNTWLSPSGCLQFSLLLRLPLSAFPASRLVFVQYLFGLAVVEACRADAVLGNIGQKVRLKWPNDIYAIADGSTGPKKIGGILVNTSFTGGKVEIVIGCGLNVLNPPPITSLAHLIPPGVTGVEPTMEGTAATIMATFQRMWTTFIASRGSFEPFMDLYIDRWLHSDQLVTLTTVDPPALVRIVGITSDHGLLRTIPEHAGYLSARGEPYIDLQPDGNSFDLMAGLIRTKT